MQVPLLDLKAQFAGIENEITEAIREVCVSQQFILGPKVEELERGIAEYCQAKYGVGVSSGTDALLVALTALGVGPGDEVITSPYTFFATAGAIARVGARPVFCDIDPHTFNLAPGSVAAFLDANCEPTDAGAMNRRTGGSVKVLLPVHLYGQMADMGALMHLADCYGLRVVEDAAQAVGSEYPGGQRSGSVGDIGCFSFFPSKNLGGFGDGGMCTTNDADLDEKMRVLRAHGSKPKYFHSCVGGNYRLDALQAAVVAIKLKSLDSWTARRQENALFYDEALRDLGNRGTITTPPVTEGYRHVYNQYVIRAERRDELRTWLQGYGIGTEIYYPLPLHMQVCFEHLGYREGDFPESERAAKSTLALAIYPELTQDQLQYVVEAIYAFYAQ
jgi:dTDP-4-amino-4,6-dideoxygalactose transaminase